MISGFFVQADYTRTEGFVSMCKWNGQDGLTISLQHIWSTLALAMLINRTFIMSHLPASAIMRGVHEFIPFVDLFDINTLRRAYGPSCCISPGEVDENIVNYTREESNSHQLLNEFKGNKSQLIAHKHIRVCGDSFEFVATTNMTSVYENTRPHPTLKKIIRSGLQQLRNAQTIVNTTSHHIKKPMMICIHLRTEPDFMYFFSHSPATYTREQILMKMNITRIKHPKTSLAKLWSQHKDHEIKPVLYLAGSNKKDAKPFFMNSGWFSAVEDKDSIFINCSSKINSFAELLVMHHAPSSLLPSLRFEVSTVLATIDMEICKEADIFIGNNHSSLSERIASERQRSNRWEGSSTRTLESGGQYNYMVNGLAKDTNSWEDLSTLQPLHPFCTANSVMFLSYACNYVRSPMRGKHVLFLVFLSSNIG